jgi:uncharacterized protein
MAGWLLRLNDTWALRNHPGPSIPPGEEDFRPVTVITGASEGIGRELANEFASGGADVFLIARNAGKLAAAASEIEREYGVKARCLAIDLAEPGACDAVREALAAHKLYADVLVNNAGVGLCGPFVTLPRADILRLLDLNMRTLTDLMYCLLQGMLKRGRGGVINVASVAGYVPGPNQAAYYASKAYVLSLTEAVASETRGWGVRISALIPGPVSTRFHARIGAQFAPYRIFHPSMTAQAVARAGYKGFRRRKLLIVPGLLPLFNTVALRLIPHMIITPFMGWFLRRRFRR